jgi:hypothetical protein
VLLFFHKRLNDQSPDVRYYAVLGLAKATGMRVRPTRAAYDAAEPHRFKRV